MKLRTLFLIGLCLCASLRTMAQAEFSLPAYTKFKLKNGLQVYLMEQHEVPLISVSLSFPAGAIYDGDQLGLANLTAQALRLGTATYTKQQIDEQIDFMGAQLTTAASLEHARIFGQCATKDQDTFWRILEEVVEKPSFDKTEFDKAQTRLQQVRVQDKESPRDVIGDYWNAWIYAGHPYANPSDGAENTIGKIGLEEVKAFYKSRYTAEGSAIAIVGDFKTADMKGRITKLLGDWTTGKPATRLEKAPTQDYKTAKVLLVNKEDSHESRFFIGGKGVPRNHPDYVPIQVVNTILGGRFTSWLNTELRINSGLSYGARSNFDCDRLSGSFYMGSFTATETTERAIDLALQVLDSLHQVGPDEATLASARNYILGGFAPEFETSMQLALLLTDFHVYGIDERSINEFRAKVMAVDLPRAKEIIKKYFPADKLQILVIGKSDMIKKGLQKYGPIQDKDIKTAGF